MTKLANKFVLITGATSGIGEAAVFAADIAAETLRQPLCCREVQGRCVSLSLAVEILLP